MAAGRTWVEETLEAADAVPRVALEPADLVIGTECGGSDGTSVMTANPAVGAAIDRLVDAGGTAMFEELGELFGCEEHMSRRASTPEVGREIVRGPWTRPPPIMPSSNMAVSAAATSPAA